MSFTVYLDESGITDPQICVVAGFAATSLCWSMFTEEWRGALSEYGVGEFHAQVFFGRNPKCHMVGEYKRWSQDKAGNFLKQLIGVLTTSNPTLAGTAINVVDFLALSAEQRRFLTGGSYHVRSGKLRGGATKTPFHVAMQNTTIQAAKFTPTSELADFVCDDQLLLPDDPRLARSMRFTPISRSSLWRVSSLPSALAIWWASARGDTMSVWGCTGLECSLFL